MGEVQAKTAHLPFAKAKTYPRHLHSLPGSKVMHQEVLSAYRFSGSLGENKSGEDTEEPDVGVPHVRLCGGGGWVTAVPTRPADGCSAALHSRR